MPRKARPAARRRPSSGKKSPPARQAPSSEAKFRTYVEASPDALFVVDGQGRYLDFNRSALELLGVDGATLGSMTIADLVDEKDRPAALRDFAALAATGRLQAEYELVGPDGRRVWVTLRAVKLADDRFMALCQDVSARRTAERRLAESERQLRTILDTALDGFWVADPEGRLLDVNPAYAAMSGYAREELLTMRIPDLEAEESPEDTAARIRRIRERGFDRFDTTHRRKDGSLFHLSASVRLVDAGRGTMVCFFQDVTERLRAERELRESERQYRRLVDNLSAGVVVHGPDTRVLLANARACELLGLTSGQMRGKTAVDPAWRLVREDGTVMPSEEYPVSCVVRTRQPVTDLVVGVDRPATGDRAWTLVNAFPELDPGGSLLHVVVTFVDVTAGRRAEAEREALQKRLALAARMAAMGTLVAGVAHEINNPLAGLMSSQATALDEVRAFQATLRRGDPADRDLLVQRTAEVIEMLHDSETGATRIARIVKDLTAFGRPDPRRTELKLSVPVDAAMRWLTGSLPRHVTIRAEMADAPDVRASAGQIEQVVVNLVANAVNAIPEGREGVITLRVGPGGPGMVRLEVSDDGTGMSPEVMERIFDPFFTTRPVGKGTGLGLPICHAIVEAHGGTMTVESTPDVGSTFRVELPVVED